MVAPEKPRTKASTRDAEKRAAMARLLVLSAAVLCASGLARAATFFAYTDPQRVFTLEFGKENRAVLNVLNLTDYVQILEAQGILVVGKSGSATVGQVFAEKGEDGQVRYFASRILKERSVTGVDLWGAFRGGDDVLKVFIQMGGRVFEMESLAEPAFETFLNRLSELDLKASDVATAMKKGEIGDLGTFYPWEESEEYRKVFDAAVTDDGVNPTKVIRRTPILPTPEAEAAGYAGKVSVKVVIDRAGNVVSVKFDTTPPHGMGRRIEETIRNGWRFLPATSGGEVVPSEAKITLEFGPRHGA
ncbi:MAG: energy transducer TonB [Acidobacteria bacterium]|nr:energy transducer TonB [Acidobacteriota bacterium]